MFFIIIASRHTKYCEYATCYDWRVKQNIAIEDLARQIKQQSQSKDTFFIAVDGRSGVGKSTISGRLAELLPSAVVIDQDDFYMGGTYDHWLSLSPKERYNQTIDWLRLRQEVLLPLRAGQTARWRAYDWDLDTLSSHTSTAEPAMYVIVEGTYSARPELRDEFDMLLLVKVAEPERQDRLEVREGEDFSEEWDVIWKEAEDYYFTEVLHETDMDATLDNTPLYE